MLPGAELKAATPGSDPGNRRLGEGAAFSGCPGEQETLWGGLRLWPETLEGATNSLKGRHWGMALIPGFFTHIHKPLPGAWKLSGLISMLTLCGVQK